MQARIPCFELLSLVVMLKERFFGRLIGMIRRTLWHTPNFENSVLISSCAE
jgi:hypothetical protein